MSDRASIREPLAFRRAALRLRCAGFNPIPPVAQWSPRGTRAASKAVTPASWPSPYRVTTLTPLTGAETLRRNLAFSPVRPGRGG